MIRTRRSPRVAGQFLFAVFSFLLSSGRLLADGDETLGAPAEGVLKGGSVVLAAGVGLQDAQPGKISLEVPKGLRIVQVLLYWGLRSSQGDEDVYLNGSTRVTGDLIGTSTAFPGSDTRPYVFRADITGLGLIVAGLNEVTVSNLLIKSTGFSNGAGLVVVADDGSSSSLEIRDGADFAYWKFSPPVNTTARQKFGFPASNEARRGELVLIAGDHIGLDKGRKRPTTLEVAVELGGLQVLDNPLQGADGDSWDTLSIPLLIPAGARSVEAQLFSDSRTGSLDSPSSFYWLFAALRIEGAAGPGVLAYSGTVYCDSNGNADRDGGEEGIAGVEVSLVCALDGETVKRSTITGPDGSYRFEGILPRSTCTAAVVPSPALAGKEATEVCATREGIAADVTDCDFGFAKPPVVGDTVFLDSSGDGAQQAGEKGLAGVKVSIVAPAGGGFPGYSDSAVTDLDGKYLFRIPGVPGGGTVVATVSVDPSTGDARGKTLTTPNPQETIPLGPGGMDLARDFGLRPGEGAKVGDTVFSDLNGDGRQGGGELGLGDVKVTIRCPPGDGFPGFEDSTVTDSQGKYLFMVPEIPEGRQVVCTVSIDPTTGGARDKDLTTPNPQDTRPLGPGDSDLDRDFGLRPRGDARVGDTVFCDLNGNGSQEAGEPGIRGVPVSLSVPAAGGFPGSNQSAVTGADGKYLFTIAGIPFGSTVVATVTIDAASPAAAGKLLTTPNPQVTRPLGPGAEDRDRDFGLKPLAAKVGDTVFCDLNGNGILDEGEPGISGVKVSIVAPAAGAFGGFSDSATTDAQGKYLFVIEGVPPETAVVATVEVDPSTGGAAGLELTTPNPQRTASLGPGFADLARDFGFRCEGEVRVKTCLETKTAASGECVPVRVLLSSNRPVEGFVTAVKHDPAGLTLAEITISGTVTEANQPDFKSFEVLPDGGTAGVILDIEAPFLGNTIPAGTDLPIVVYRYCCPVLPRGGEPSTTRLRFVDNELGSPPKENAVVIGGLSYSPELCDGAVTCVPPPPGGPGPYFLCGGPTLGADNLPIHPRGAPGERVEVCFYYCSPEDNLPGHQQFDHLQGLSMALRFDCRLTCLESTFRTPPDTITAALPAEFVDFQCENDPDDGDGCELILAILVDAVDPFDGQTLPPTEIPLKLGCVDMRIADGVPCGTCLPLVFTDGVNGRGKVPVKNLYAAENQSFPARTVNCEVCVTGAPVFRRGDCNGDSKANLADAAATVSALFQTGSTRYDPPCLDACDANDDGRLDISDTVRILTWLFTNGVVPPAPGPVTPGVDPTDDKLACDATGCPEATG
ncbi:MAG: hypothetical protein HY721_08690 [Planctomycetes bacterium]|nr:hypothetical protein [Planctomycetota bacterium]